MLREQDLLSLMLHLRDHGILTGLSGHVAFHSAMKPGSTLAQFQIQTHVLSLYQLLFLLSVDIKVWIDLLEPWMLQSLHSREPFLGVCLEQATDQVLDLFRQEGCRCFWVLKLF